METRAKNNSARVRAEIDAITRQLTDVKQQLFEMQNANQDIGSLMEELATLHSKRKAKRDSLVFQQMKKGPP